MTEDGSATKILFRVHADDGSSDVETLWASALGDDRYRLDNSPFYAYSVSWRDVVFAPYDENEGFPTFKRVLTKSGHKTVRVIFEEETTADSPVMKGLLDLGCTFEGMNHFFFSIDVPPPVPLEAVRDYLVATGLDWEHADPRYSELYGDGA